MSAIRAEMPRISVDFASIGSCHSSLCSFRKIFGPIAKPLLKTQVRVGDLLRTTSPRLAAEAKVRSG